MAIFNKEESGPIKDKVFEGQETLDINRVAALFKQLLDKVNVLEKRIEALEKEKLND